jgi:DNA-binding transcriptional regulator PaaX
MKKHTKGELTISLIILGALAATNGPGMARILYKMAAKEWAKRAGIRARRELKDAAFRTALSRLKAQDLVENEGYGIWALTKKGKGALAAPDAKEKRYAKFRKDAAGKRDTIIIFDVPEKKRTVRGYLRGELVALGYERLQKSVWIGAGPLPMEFIKQVREWDVLDTVHIFSIRERGTIS